MNTQHRRTSFIWRYAIAAAATFFIASLAGTRGGAVSQNEAGSSATPPAPASSERSVLDGIYTEIEASQGERRFDQFCSDYCHKAREFAGAKYRAKWKGRTVGDLYYVIATMPPEQPGTMDPEIYRTTTAYLLDLMEYPAGEDALPGEFEVLQKIPIKELPAK